MSFSNATIAPKVDSSSTTTPKPPPVPGYVQDHLKTDIFSAHDEIIREYVFISAQQLHYDVDVWTWQQKLQSCICCVLCVPLPCLLEKYRENQIELLFSRRLALTRNGILFKTLPQRPMGAIDPCSQCCCQFERHDALRKGGTTKTIPYGRIQDVGMEEAAGSFVKQYCCCTCGQIPNPVNKVWVDTAGAGIELECNGLGDPVNFRKAVLALKHGKPLPAIETPYVLHYSNLGAHQGATSVAASEEAKIALPAMHPSGQGPVPSPAAAAAAIAVQVEHNKLIGSMHMMMNAHMEEQTALLKKIADNSNMTRT